MAACIVAPMSPVTEELAKLVSESLESFARPALQSAFGEGFIQANVMAAAGGNDRPPVASLLQQGAELTTASSAHVPLQRQSVYKALQKGLHDQQEMVPSAAPETHNDADGGVHKEAMFGIQKLAEVVIEFNNLNETSTVDNMSSNETYEKHLKVKSDGKAKCTATGTEVNSLASIADDAAKPIEFGSADEKSTFAQLIAKEGQAVSDLLNVHMTPTEPLYVRQRNEGEDTDVDKDFCEAAKQAAIVCRMESSEALDSIEVNQVFEEHQSDQICKSVVKGFNESSSLGRNENGQNEFEGKAVGDNLAAANRVEIIGDRHDVNPDIKGESKDKKAENIDAVYKFNYATTISHSFSFSGLNHVAFCVESLERSLHFYCGLLGLKTNLDRPDLPYRGAWLFLGAEGVHLMEVPNPDPVNGRPAHGGWDRHACLNCKNVEGVRLALEKAGIPYQRSPVPSIFTRDPDGNGLEFIEVNP